MKRNPRQKNDNVAGKPGPGRPKGSKDKIPQDLKKRVLAVWAQLEAEGKGLHEEAKKKPAWFYENFLKPMLPKNVDIGSDGPIVLKVIYEQPKGMTEKIG